MDLSIMTNSKDIQQQNHDQLKTETKNTPLWAIVQDAITEWSEMVAERQPSLLLLQKQYELISVSKHGKALF